MSTIALSKYTGRFAIIALAATAGLCFARPVLAQDNGYHVGENKTTTPPPAPPAASPTHRVARIDYLSGKVTTRSDDTAKWVKAEMNRPLVQGSQLWVEEGGRAEVRFDDGSVLRLGSNSVATLQTVYVDAQGEYTQIKINSGIAMLEPREERSVFEVNTPFLGVKTVGPSRIRIGVADDVEVAVSRGRANLEGTQGKQTLASGDFVTLRPADTTYVVKALPSPDSWERWNEDRDHRMLADTYPVHHSPPPPGYSAFFLSLGFPIYGGGPREYRHR